MFLFFMESAFCIRIFLFLFPGRASCAAWKKWMREERPCFASSLGEIGGQDLHYTGALFRGSGLKISYVPQDTTGLSGPLQDFAFRCGIDDPLFRAILRKLDFSRTQFEKDLSMLSEGQKRKCFSPGVSVNAHLYLWDEPLNYIDVFPACKSRHFYLNMHLP